MRINYIIKSRKKENEVIPENFVKNHYYQNEKVSPLSLGYHSYFLRNNRSGYQKLSDAIVQIPLYLLTKYMTQKLYKMTTAPYSNRNGLVTRYKTMQDAA